MKKIHLRTNIASAQLLTAEEMKCLTGGLFGTSTSQKDCPLSCSGGCVHYDEFGFPTECSCRISQEDNECHCE